MTDQRGGIRGLVTIVLLIAAFVIAVFLADRFWRQPRPTDPGLPVQPAAAPPPGGVSSRPTPPAVVNDGSDQPAR